MSLGRVTSHHGRGSDAILSALATESVNLSVQHVVSNGGDDDTLSILTKGTTDDRTQSDAIRHVVPSNQTCQSHGDQHESRPTHGTLRHNTERNEHTRRETMTTTKTMSTLHWKTVRWSSPVSGERVVDAARATFDCVSCTVVCHVLGVVCACGVWFCVLFFFLLMSSLSSEHRSKKPSRVPGHDPQAIFEGVHASVHLNSKIVYFTDILSDTQWARKIA